MSDRNKIRTASQNGLSEDVSLIPRWSMVAAVLAFCAVEYFYWVILPGERQHAGPPIGLRIYFSLSWGALAALNFLMVGYVSRDAARRAMSTSFWMIFCFLMPVGIGLVVYFLLRQPVLTRCPACGTDVQHDYHHCPQCNYQLVANCGCCYRTVHITDLYCTRCGHDLAGDNTPQRLRAFHAG
jgi:hypothetical protein